jgi:hypothetical protein
VFACPSVKYLRHLITPVGIQTDPEKVAAIEKLAVPLNLKHLQIFFQKCSWFLLNFAGVTQPLTDLTKKGTVWTWAQEQQTATVKYISYVRNNSETYIKTICTKNQ